MLYLTECDVVEAHGTSVTLLHVLSLAEGNDVKLVVQQLMRS